MSSKISTAPRFILDSSISYKKSKKQSKKEKKMNIYSENKENISSNIMKKINEDDISSTKELKSKENTKTIEKQESKSKENDIESISIKPIKLSKNDYERYTQKMKERTMRMELEKMYNETERLKNKYEEKNSNLYLFSNNPQFKKMIKEIEGKLFYFITIEIILNIYSAIIYFKLIGDNEGIGLSNLCLTIVLIAITSILLISLKIGVLNDPHLSKAFRFFVILNFLISIASFCLNIITELVFINMENTFMMDYKIIIYLLFLIILFVFVIRLKIGFNLFVESSLILLGKKTEYSVLILREEKSNNNYNNLSTSISNDGLNKTSLELLGENNNKNKEINKEEEVSYMNYNYFNKFHYSVCSERKN